MKFRDIGEAAIYEALEASSKFPPFNSSHEGFAVILEEIDELWDEVKKKNDLRSHEDMRKEALQVAAMAIRFINDICETKNEA